tara:strand:+ start:1852 stop:2295 length:444 start_codon:yes stop_codon:yes gene_type:complete
MELNDELKLLLIKTEAHRDDNAAVGVFNTIRDLEDIDEESAYQQRLDMFYSMHSDVGTTDSDGKWTEPSEEELKAKLIEYKYVETPKTEIWEVEGYENEAAWNAAEYQRKRAAEYPSIADQLDEIYHNGLDSWKAKIKETKDKYPKE